MVEKAPKKRKSTQGENHWKHELFVQNLTAAAGSITLEEAAPEWGNVKLGLVSDNQFDKGPKKNRIPSNCQLCTTPIEHYALIHCTKNGNRLFIGLDCWEKLVFFVATGKMLFKSSGMADKHVKSLRAYVKDHLPPNIKLKQFVGWLDEQKLSPELRNAVEMLKKCRHAGTTMAADALAAYYIAERRFTPQAILSKNEWWAANHFKDIRESLPETLTLAEVETLRKTIALYAEDEKRQAEAIKKAVYENILDTYVRAGRPFPRETFAAFMRPYAGGLYDTKSIWLVLYVNNVRVQVEVSTPTVLSALGRDEWNYELERVVKKTLPAEIFAIERSDGILTLSPATHAEWMARTVTFEADEKARKARELAELEEKVRVAREKGIAHLERLVAEQPQNYRKGVLRFECYRDQRTGLDLMQWSFRQDGMKYILDRHCGWMETTEPTYVVVTRTIGQSGKVHFVWPLVWQFGQFEVANGYWHLTGVRRSHIVVNAELRNLPD